MSEPTHIVVRGASEHNLRGVDVDMPRDALVVFTGVSGSGKSSLAFDTIYKEGQRRFVESLSAYARQFLGQMERPRVESVEGISPTLSIDQKTVNRNPRSTVGTVTEIYDHLRLLLARLGTPRCPKCGTAVSRLTVDDIVDAVLERGEDRKTLLLGPVVKDRKGEYRKELEELARDGWLRARIDGEVRRLDEEIPLGRYEKHTIEVVVDRLVPDISERERLVEAVETGLRLGQGVVVAVIEGQDEIVFSAERACPNHPDISLPELEPRLFSFNAPQGACPACQGLGHIEGFVESQLIDFDRAAIDAFQAFNAEGRIPFGHFDRAALAKVIDAVGGDPKQPLKRWPDARRERLVHGDPDLVLTLEWVDRDGKVDRRRRAWRGLVPMVERIWRYTGYSRLKRFRERVVCPECGGTRVNAIARAVDFRGKNVVDLTTMTVSEAHAFFSELVLDGDEVEVGELLVAEIRDRLQFLHEVGLGYLSLDRSAATLSGGEAQRIRLAAQVGSALRGVTYVLDEPSIGLHARDNQRLLTTLRRLRDRGNSVLVVEHDAETIEAADWVIDVGPGAGREGGHITASTTAGRFRHTANLTARYLRGEVTIPMPSRRRAGNGKRLVVRGARAHNLHDVDVAFPLGTFIVVTGVSGSGKSSLVFEVLEEALTAHVAHRPSHAACEGVDGLKHVDKVIRISQQPIGRTPRSNPATYTGAFDVIRDLFAQTPEARARGYKKGRFSFNVHGGRCEACQGAGVKTVEMQFLPSVEVPCDVCEGRRFNRETLEITFKGHTIADVLDMTVAEAHEVFRHIPKLHRILGTLEEVGLDYVPLGQPSTTVSGGEAQRMKLASELHRPATGKTIYLLDEPTTGLHFHDVAKLLLALDQLVEAGNTVVVIEHHTDVIKSADHVIDLGPEGGAAGGQVVGEGPPEAVAKLDTPTGRALAALPEISGAREVAAEAPAPRYRARREGTSRELVLEGARKHNLHGIDVRIPHGKMTVITGVSGSGKTSLAFDTIFSEGQRQYVESLSTYARRFLGRMERAPVDHVEGLAPAIAIDQRNASHNPRSTVATVTEIHDVLRILYARVGIPHCARCGREVRGWSPSEAARWLQERDPGAGWLVTRLRPAEHADERRKGLMEDGWTRLLGPENREVALEDDAANALLEAGARIVCDRFNPRRTALARIAEAVAAAYALGAGEAEHVAKHGEDVVLTAQPTCPVHGEVLPEALTPRHFSFNSRLGACPRCEGLGVARRIDPDKLFPEQDEGFWDGMDPRVRAVLVRSPRNRTLVAAVLEHLGLSEDTPASTWTEEQWAVLLEGSAETFDLTWSQEWGATKRTVEEERAWPGLFHILQGWSSRLEWITVERECPRCQGGRLRPELLAVRIGGLGIHQLTRMCIDDAVRVVSEWDLRGERAAIAERPLLELTRRLKFLRDVGLGYLELERPARSLSGGEAQRIRLASQLGGGLTGVIYVLDEPTIGLHPRDTDKLLGTLEGLRDQGNTVIVVEHDPDSIWRADHVLDLGPGAGRHGGRVVASGTPAEIAEDPRSVTGRWLSGRERVPARGARRAARSWITLRAPTGNNLRGEEVRFPTGVWVGVSGVSGSGKSTLVMDTLAPAVQAFLGQEAAPLPHGGLEVGERVDRLVLVDQSPIGRTPRSTPATYTNVMDPLRSLFAKTPGARARGWNKGRFSFNSKGGRCELCEGRGATLVEMHFLPDVWVTCPSCRGRRFNQDTLSVRWKGHSISDVLNLRIDEALELFTHHKRIRRPLKALADVGLGYLTLGQPATTLSGGEAQRVKLASELTSRRGHAIYVLDEPTTGLHLADVARLVEVLHRLVDAGHTVITIEHHLDMLDQADWLIDLGPEGGAEGGRVVAAGTPEAVQAAGTATGEALARGFRHEKAAAQRG